jgi:bud site selection protein 31
MCRIPRHTVISEKNNFPIGHRPSPDHIYKLFKYSHFSHKNRSANPAKKMSRIRRRPDLNPPPEWAEIREQMLELNAKLREAQNMCVDENMTREQIAAIQRSNWTRCRVIYLKRFVEKTMGSDLFEWILNQGFADRHLIKIWQRPGYERACCTECVSDKDPAGGCICRRPVARNETKGLRCRECWCHGCATCDTERHRIPDTELPFDDLQQTGE